MKMRRLAMWVILALLVFSFISMGYIVSRITNRVVGIVTVDELLAHGYYVYLLPEERERAEGWTKEIWLTSYSRDCYDQDSLGWYPVHIDYRGRGDTGFSMRLSSEDQLWEDEVHFPTIPVNVSWSDTHQAEIDRQEDGIILRIQDQLGTDIVLSSTKLSEETLISLLESLDYQGAVPFSAQKPWDTGCGPTQTAQPN